MLFGLYLGLFLEPVQSRLLFFHSLLCPISVPHFSAPITFCHKGQYT